MKKLIALDMDGTIVFHEKGHNFKAVMRFDGLCRVKDLSDGAFYLGFDYTHGPEAIFCTTKTIRKLQALKDRYTVVIVTAGRASTVYKRFNALQVADYIIHDSGAVISDRNLNVDEVWKEYLADEIPLIEECKVELEEAGWILDDAGRYGALRIRLQDNKKKGEQKFRDLCEQQTFHPSLITSTNLGHLDIFLARAGKANALDYLRKKLGLEMSAVVGVGDDENDIEFLSRVGTPIVLKSSYPQLLSVAYERGWRITHNPTVRGIHEILDSL